MAWPTRGIGGGSVGRAVASDTRDLLTSAKIYIPIVYLNRKDENKEKEAGNGPSFKKWLGIQTPNTNTMQSKNSN